MPIVYPNKTEMPSLDPGVRRRNWAEVATGYTEAQAVAEAQRCLQCQDPRCEVGCPVNVPIREFVRCVALRDFDGAARAIRRRNLLPAICGRVCPVEHQCELHCVLLGKQEPVSIGRLERFVADWQRAHPSNGAEVEVARRPEKIAIVGSGPSGLTAASDLAQLGYAVTVFEALHAIGGVLRYGIPEYRLPKAIVDEDVEHLERMGVEFQTRRDHRQDDHDRPAPRRGGLLRRVRRHRGGLPDVHGDPGREPQGRLLGQRVPHPRQPHARVLVPRVRHAGAAAAQGGGDRRRGHGDGRRPRARSASAPRRRTSSTGARSRRREPARRTTDAPWRKGRSSTG